MIEQSSEILSKSPTQELKECIKNNLYSKSLTIESLGEDIYEKMKHEIDEEKYLHQKYKNEELSAEQISKFVAGRLFEKLIFEDYKNKEKAKFENDNEKIKEFQERMLISDVLCKFARYPQEYGFEIDMHARIPDGVMVHITKEGDFIITGLVEAKLGKLDQRGLAQIKLSGSRTTMSKIVEQINEKKAKSSPEVEEVSKILDGHKLLTKSVDIKNKEKIMDMILVIPSRYGETNGRYSVGFKEQGLDLEYDRIRNEQKIQEQSFNFTAEEIWNMTEVIIENIR